MVSTQDFESWELGSKPCESDKFLFYISTKILPILEAHGKKVDFFIVFNDSPCFSESPTPGKKIEKNFWYPKIAKNDWNFSLRIPRTPNNFNRSLMVIWHLLSHIWCMCVLDFWKKASFIYNFYFNYFFVIWNFAIVRIRLLYKISSRWYNG